MKMAGLGTICFTAFIWCTAHQVLGQGQQGSNCGVPLNVVGPTIDPRRMMGTWYEYMYRTPGLDDINCVNIYTPMGHVSDPVNGWAVAVNWTVSFNLVAPGSPCMGIFTSSNFSMNGVRNGQTFLPRQPSAAPTRYVTLFTDYTTVEIMFRCQTPNQQTGKCTEPLFWANTRLQPSQLSDAQKTYISSSVNAALSPYCYSVTDLKLTAQDPNLAACRPSAPAAFSQLLQSVPVMQHHGPGMRH